jgi:BTB/POZ domain-containing protein KCTD9
MTNHHPTKAELQASFKNIINTPDRPEYEHDLKREAEKFGIPVDEYRRKYEKDRLRASFANISDTHDRLQHEYDISKAAKKLCISVDDYRRCYEQRKDISFISELDDGANFIERVRHNWRRTFPQRQLLLKFISKYGATIGSTITAFSAIVGVGQYFLDEPTRAKQAKYQAWQIVNSAKEGERSSAGRIEALQDLVKYKVDLAKVNVRNAQLVYIKLPKAELSNANLNNANLNNADLNNANLNNANLEKAALIFTNLSNANLSSAKLSGATISADLSGANLSGTDLGGAHLEGATNINPEQIKMARNWRDGCYDPDLLQELEISQNPKCDEKMKS